MNDYFLLLSAIFRPPVPSLKGLRDVQMKQNNLKGYMLFILFLKFAFLLFYLHSLTHSLTHSEEFGQEPVWRIVREAEHL